MDELIKYFIDNIFDGTIDSIKFTLSGFKYKMNDERITKLNDVILRDYISTGAWNLIAVRRIFE